MCGIAGYFNVPCTGETRQALLRQMCAAIAHRGPDDDGYFSDEWAGLGMRRLSIIDLTTGHQPIANEDGTKQIIFNGEIYNYQELRPQLLEQGHRFTTASDAEVILHQYEQYGSDCVHHFNGMFAIAIWDQSARRLFLARDRMGVKPLYYYWDGQRLLFASEIKALLSSGYVSRVVNKQALWDYLTFRYVPQPETIWKNVYKLPPGHTLTIEIDHPEPVVRRYWDIPYTDDIFPRSAAEYEQEFERLFLDAVRLRLIADVPVGILLSGGLDSSAVAAAIAEVHNARLSSFSVAFQDSQKTDERKFARQVAAHVGTDHNEITIGVREFLDFLPRFVHYTDEPLADLASVPLYYVSGLARQKVKVVLSGEGSDEILAGYHFNHKARLWNWMRQFQRLPAWVRQEIPMMLARRLGGEWPRRVQSANTLVSQLLTAQPFNMTRDWSSADKGHMLKESWFLRDSTDILLAEAARPSTKDPLHQALYVYCQSWLVEDLLMKADKMTMANSIELRVPFLDYRLVEWAARTPAWVKVRRNMLGQYQTKWILRRFASKRLPSSIITRSKQGFPVPVYDWLSSHIKPWATELLTSPDAQLYRWFQTEPVHRQLLIGTSPAGNRLERQRLWNLLILELWMQEWEPT